MSSKRACPNPGLRKQRLKPVSEGTEPLLRSRCAAIRQQAVQRSANSRLTCGAYVCLKDKNSELKLYRKNMVRQPKACWCCKTPTGSTWFRSCEALLTEAERQAYGFQKQYNTESRIV